MSRSSCAFSRWLLATTNPSTISERVDNQARPRNTTEIVTEPSLFLLRVRECSPRFGGPLNDGTSYPAPLAAELSALTAFANRKDFDSAIYLLLLKGMTFGIKDGLKQSLNRNSS